ncbi:D-2-hydroxyacid dehydrogenase [Fusibacter bizertensis]|jgi:D-3-phosphoglycerate dehydrogenase (EC 1.1.1.95)|uniref:D-2-hydroxyacid dehydrogenase n=1 Tax=Fusibacter bizertensis TaxID=1488331 RepID=A0ABT6NFB5_9FIRM|nr:D-2-hydroxyacid dehydrogenase [Fusibacter bizertensis]MDH8679125.1 D-2-hydroxyacid dehydrogenase [Fusibacter bizertensis]
MLKILANDGMDKSAVDALISLGHQVDTAHYDGEALIEQLKDTDVVVIRSATKLRKDLIDQVKGSRLKLMIRAGVGIDNIDHVYATENGFTVKNTPNSSSAAVAELAIGHMFSLARFIHIANVTMRNGEWNKSKYAGVELNGKTLGLIGMGRISNEVAVRAKALGMKVVYTNRRGKLEEYPDFEYKTLDELLKISDFISLHIPFDKKAGATLKKEQFDMMKDGVYIINTARGGVVCENDLLDALNSGKVAGAGIDVFEEEPTKNTALINHPRVSCTPHIGASTGEAQERIGEETIAVIRAHFNV